MPLKDFHVAKIREAKNFLQIVKLYMIDEKQGVLVYGGRWATNPTGATRTQSLRFPKDKFTVLQAVKWLKDNNLKALSIEPAVGINKEHVDSYRRNQL